MQQIWKIVLENYRWSMHFWGNPIHNNYTSTSLVIWGQKESRPVWNERTYNLFFWYSSSGSKCNASKIYKCWSLFGKEKNTDWGWKSCPCVKRQSLLYLCLCNKFRKYHAWNIQQFCSTCEGGRAGVGVHWTLNVFHFLFAKVNKTCNVMITWFSSAWCRKENMKHGNISIDSYGYHC